MDRREICHLHGMIHRYKLHHTTITRIAGSGIRSSCPKKRISFATSSVASFVPAKSPSSFSPRISAFSQIFQSASSNPCVHGFNRASSSQTISSSRYSTTWMRRPLMMDVVHGLQIVFEFDCRYASLASIDEYCVHGCSPFSCTWPGFRS